MTAFCFPYRRDAATGLTTATPFIPPHPAGTIALFEARGHRVTVRQIRGGGSNRYTLDNERERTALELSNRFEALYERKH